MRNLAPYISFQNLSEGMDGREEAAAFGEVGFNGTRFCRSYRPTSG